MKTLFTTAALTLALAVPAFAQDAKPVIPPATTSQAPAVKVEAPKTTAPAVAPAAKVEAPKADAKAPAAAAKVDAKSNAKTVNVKIVNINTATPSELDALPKIGVARTKAIIAGRPYKSVDELLSKKVLPKDAFEAVKTKVSVK